MHFAQEKEGKKKKKKKKRYKKKEKSFHVTGLPDTNFFGHVQTELMPAHTDKRRNLVTNEIQSLG